MKVWLITTTAYFDGNLTFDELLAKLLLYDQRVLHLEECATSQAFTTTMSSISTSNNNNWQEKKNPIIMVVVILRVGP